jgi:deoxyribonuclease-4
MKVGFHISIAGGLRNIVPRAQKLQCSTIQFFTRSPRAWLLNTLDRQDIRDFRTMLKQSDISPVFVHTPYLLNCASPDRRLFKKSINALVIDLQRSDMLGAPYVIMHCGSAENTTRGLKLMAQGITTALNKADNEVVLLLENTAGGGNSLGYQFEQLASIIMKTKPRKRVGVVLDTAHLFAAGYDLRTRKSTDTVIRAFNSIVGLDKLHLVHLNDSKAACGSHLDRHWHIGKGKIGKGLAHVINNPLLRHLPFIMETPRKSDKDDLKNLRTAKRMVRR